MAEHGCENCGFRARYDRNPKSFLGRLWRWHAGWCPGWNKYINSLPDEQRTDGTRAGYDLPVIRAMKEATSARIVASGGGGKLEHFYDGVEAGATILLAASVFHFRLLDIPQLKYYLRGSGVNLV